MQYMLNGAVSHYEWSWSNSKLYVSMWVACMYIYVTPLLCTSRVVAMEPPRHQDHTYASSILRNSKVSPSIENIQVYLSRTLDKTFSIENISLPSYNWLVITNSQQVVLSQNSRIVHTARILIEHDKGLNQTRGLFQVLFKTNRQIKVTKVSDVDELVHLLEPRSGYKLCPGIDNYLVEGVRPKTLTTSVDPVQRHCHVACEQWIGTQKTCCTKCKALTKYLKRRQRIAAKKERLGGPSTLHGQHWNNLTDKEKKRKYSKAVFRSHHQKRHFERKLKRYKKFEIYLSEQQSKECSEIFKTLSGSFQPDVSAIIRYLCFLLVTLASQYLLQVNLSTTFIGWWQCVPQLLFVLNSEANAKDVKTGQRMKEMWEMDVKQRDLLWSDAIHNSEW